MSRSFANEIQERKPLFSNQKLMRLIGPLVGEQLLSVMIGLTDTIMVSKFVSEAAVSGVSTVESINILLIQVFSALATGGAVVIAQYIGHGDRENSCVAANQLVYVVTLISLLISIGCVIFSMQILYTVFGRMDPEIMSNADIFFKLSAASYPLLALYNAGAALFRAMGNSKISMFTALIMNVMNILGNIIFIVGFHMGVEGSALSSLISRLFAAVVMLYLAHNRDNFVYLRHLLRFKLHGSMIQNILRIGVPNGLENGMFQIGKLMVQRIITELGMAAIAANAIVNSLTTIVSIPGTAIGLALLTIVGQCVGAHDFHQATYYTNKLLKYSYVAMTLICAVVALFARQLVGVYGLTTPDAVHMAVEIIRYYAIFSIFIWIPAFTLPNALRAAGDARFSMTTSIISMWLFRILFSFIFVYGFHLGLLGIWMAMFLDWVVRSIVFTIRYHTDAWKTHALV